MSARDFTSPNTLQSHLSGTFHPLTSLTRLSGGFANFTFRGQLSSNSTVIIKHAEPFAALSINVAIDPIRCFFEHSVLASSLPNLEGAVVTPKSLHYDKEHAILITTDAGEGSRDLKALLLSGDPGLETTRLGTALGAFLSSLHQWGRSQASAQLREILQGNAQARGLWQWATYGRLVETISLFPTVLSAYEQVFCEVSAAPAPALADETIIHGDFWCGNILPYNGVVTVIDWEMSRLGGPWEDLAQMCAELYLPFQFRGVKEGLAIISAFLKEYGPVGEEVARRAVVHFGVHMVVWPPRVPGWGEKEQLQECVTTGAEFIERGWRKDWAWVKESVLAEIVQDSWINL
ncbi:kinase-like domain-containing protein [Sphaerosporella brunnea]|uniref:Kinase-like domain-containing protein n=1 Tax=Sphaerosporella brunnea TaxID=1250544 RepID=A0A5J5F0M5_9PEZI|nr:kinase-like domain-containing protein [Sphaerosporella brunnea]